MEEVAAADGCSAVGCLARDLLTKQTFCPDRHASRWPVVRAGEAASPWPVRCWPWSLCLQVRLWRRLPGLRRGFGCRSEWPRTCPYSCVASMAPKVRLIEKSFSSFSSSKSRWHLKEERPSCDPLTRLWKSKKSLIFKVQWNPLNTITSQCYRKALCEF